MKHDVQRTARLGVDLSRYTWLPNEQEVAPQQANVTPAPEATKTPAPEDRVRAEDAKVDMGPGKVPIAFGSLLMILGLIAGFIIHQSAKENTLMLVSIVAMNIGVSFLLLPGKWKFWSFLPALVVGIISLMNMDNFWTIWIMFFALGSPLPALILGLKVITRRILARRRWRTQKENAWYEENIKHIRPKLAPKHEFVYGKVGGVAGATGVFSEAAISAGVAGEQSTAYLLETFLKDIPGVTIFHGLKFPGSHNADVDHAVIRGNTLYLIDSKQYKSGTYSWKTTREHGERISGADGHGYKNHMDAAHAGYRQMIGREVRIVSLLIIHGRDIKTGSRVWSSQGVGVFNAHDGLNHIGSGLASDHYRSNDRAKDVLLSQLKG